ncbi:serine/threonine protein kinase (plasmid) [Trichormus variabilis ATCC 29413]|uniref:non-specific serine/threonine protein kinase n=2 Tax=Anabaena variabilis TaxID=264691 RepID=Q3M272_TRIV2|nr:MULTISPECIES: serine/threonine-protein kinase [Nostocaceae]ABA24914.1 serine/threonine protein kinase [Trichormus variabilis ATCC 29413]MBC1217943.1 serine/threonine protein kinase [Trichormus variabilis ARAD]MBC1259187.1 serine/threonine protein kinase [Trichormus variabilis V5]MBC1270801.1 serine/threonine protein kinase [Trichormus variabilis FSR]MBC1305634.1 serine/threonine protein kinase [Trichormus variabilis N2B]
MCSGFPDNQKYLQSLEENSNSELKESNTLLNDRYRILKPLGQGGFGKTFLAIDEKSTQNSQDEFDYSPSNICVIKQFLPQLQTSHHSQKALELFQQESLLLAELGKHPQIPQLLNTFEQDGQHYLVQEWVDGLNLKQELAEAGTFDEAEIIHLLRELLSLLQFIHSYQVVHRDIKPANIIRRRTDRQLFLVDFGVAKYNWHLVTGTIIGSAEYAAPEQIRGKAVFASDLYSLGVTCLHLLTKVSPFDLYDCSENNWIWDSYLVEPISPSLEKIICKLVQPATKLRYHFAAEALIDLNNLPKDFGGSSNLSTNTNNEDFETPYFGLRREADLIGSVTSFADSSVGSVTIFDPKTKTWHYIPAKTEGGELARKVAAFLAPRLAAATPTVQEEKSIAVDQKARNKLNKMYQIIVTAIAFTIACLALAVESNSISTNLKAEISRTIQQFMNIGHNETPQH